jgi:hypothetical protein
MWLARLTSFAILTPINARSPPPDLPHAPWSSISASVDSRTLAFRAETGAHSGSSAKWRIRKPGSWERFQSQVDERDHQLHQPDQDPERIPRETTVRTRVRVLGFQPNSENFEFGD